MILGIAIGAIGLYLYQGDGQIRILDPLVPRDTSYVDFRITERDTLTEVEYDTVKVKVPSRFRRSGDLAFLDPDFGLRVLPDQRTVQIQTFEPRTNTLSIRTAVVPRQDVFALGPGVAIGQGVEPALGAVYVRRRFGTFATVTPTRFTTGILWRF